MTTLRIFGLFEDAYLQLHLVQSTNQRSKIHFNSLTVHVYALFETLNRALKFIESGSNFRLFPFEG